MGEADIERHERAVVRPDRDHPADAVRAWLHWFGWGRIVASVVSIVVVVGGAWVLLRAPAPPVEHALPMASTLPTVATSLPAPTGAAAPSSRSAVVVHVAGAVHAPGVYSLRHDGRLIDAIDAAGGARDGADLDRVNLAAPVVDGQRIYVPEVGVEPPPSFAEPAAPSGSPIPAGPIDLNSADEPTLQTLPGVGPAIAAAIVDDRTRNGPFASVDELDRVPGIGPAKLAAIRELVTA